MEQLEEPDQPVRKPSVFMYSVVGYLIASALAIPAIVGLCVKAGDYNEQGALQILVAAGAFGAFIGFQIAARRLKAFGGGGMAEEWKRFWASLSIYGLGAIILVGSFAITVLGSLIAVAVMGPTTSK